MPQLEVQKFLIAAMDRNCGKICPIQSSLDELKDKYAIDYKFHHEMYELVLLKYNQCSSPFEERIVQECRGLILDTNDWSIVCFPFYKFFNSQELLAANINWNTAKVQEKLDGSLICMWYYQNDWHVSTSGCPDGYNYVGDWNISFRELFWQTFVAQNGDQAAFDERCTYMFELTSPLNRVVVDYKESKITLIGMRNNITYEEQVVVPTGNIPAVREYPLTCLEGCLDAANKLNPLENEGYVVVDSAYNRIKIKNPVYIAIHHMYSSFSLKNLAEAIRKGEFEELAVAFESYPQYLSELKRLHEVYLGIIEDCERLYAMVKNIPDQKKFAMQVKMHRYPSILFAMRKTNKSPAEIIQNMTQNCYLSLMGVK